MADIMRAFIPLSLYAALAAAIHEPNCFFHDDDFGADINGVFQCQDELRNLGA